MISQLASKHADKCRFCWMCRHLCPVQLQTGKEINTPRAKGLLLSMTARGKEFDSDMAQAMYAFCVMHVQMTVLPVISRRCSSVKHVQKQ